MTRINRAAGYAVASVAFVAAVTFSAPSQAQAAAVAAAVPVTQAAPLAAPAPATTVQVGASQAAAPAALLPSAPPAQVAATPVTAATATATATAIAEPASRAPAERKGVVANLWIKATSLLGMSSPSAAPGVQSGLDQLVSAYAVDRTDSSEQDCLAKAVYFEARSEPTEGQLAVAQVVMNRAASGRYPGSLCAVVTQKAQFSFIQRGRFPTPDLNSAAWRKAVAVARIAQGGLAGTLPSGVLWYHATYVSPRWGRKLTRTAQIGLHIFYS